MRHYDYLVVGSGLFGSVFSYLASQAGKKILLVEKRDHVGGNIFTRRIQDIDVHCYGAHIFHTKDKEVWDFIQTFAEFNNFVNSPIANYQGRLFNLPFNMNTFYQIWGVKTPGEAADKIQAQREAAHITNPNNLEEKAISLVGEDIYKILIKGYTEKQWGRSCKELPPSIISRIPVRMTFDNNYFNDPYQGIPITGYTQIIEKLLFNCEVLLNTDFLKQRQVLESFAKNVIYTGPIDAYFNFCHGPLEYRKVRFETEVLNVPNYQGVAVVNYTERTVPYTRIIEHKHFVFGNQPQTVISREYPDEWHPGDEPYYPINDDKNNKIYEKYKLLAEKEKNVYFGGRLGTYKYYDMDKVIRGAFNLARQIL